MYNMISEFAKMGYRSVDDQQVHATIFSLPNDWDHIDVVFCLIKYIITFEYIHGCLALEEERQ